MTPKPRLLSLQEANSILPEIEVLVIRMVEVRKKHEGLHDALLMQEILNDAERARGVQSADHQQAEENAREIEEILSALEKDMARIRDLGGVIRSLEAGWIDFPGQHQGQTVYFSWKLGEKTIQYYLPQNGSLTNRLPLN